MSYRMGIVTLAIAAVTLAPSIAGAHQAAKTGTTTQKVDDATLDNRIEGRLKADATLKGDAIDVAVEHGVVTLTGTVHSRSQRARAERLAKIAGVTRVENKLEVETAATTGIGAKTDKAMDKAGRKADKSADKAEDKAERAREKAGEKSEKAKDKSAKAGESAKSGAAGAGEAITDGWITTKVKTQFVGEDALKGSDINVDTTNHIVTLKGTVASAAGRARAVEIAKATKGVTRVVDNLTIAPKK